MNSLGNWDAKPFFETEKKEKKINHVINIPGLQTKF